MQVNITYINNNPSTIYNVLRAQLGREPSADELRGEVWRIIREAKND